MLKKGNWEREVRIERGVRTRPMVRNENGCSKKMAKNTRRCSVCSAMAVVKPYIDTTKPLCHIHGKMHKKVWIAVGDIVLVGRRDYQDDMADIILKYIPDDAMLLKVYNELPENISLNEGITGGLDDDDNGINDYIKFEDEDINKI